MRPPVNPPMDKNAFLPDVIDFNIKNNPEQPFYIYAESEESIKTITHLEFGRGIHRVAHALRPCRSGTNGEVVAILALADTILYNAVVAGLIVAGLVPFPISPRNTAASVATLLAKTSCHRLVVGDSVLTSHIPGVKAALVDYQVSIENMPSLASVYPYLAQEVAEHPFEPYPLPIKRPSVSDTCLILHSSGSTGAPKTIAQTHLHWMQAVSSEFRDYVPRLIVGSMSLPGFHAGGISSQLFTPAYGVVATAVFPPTGATPGALPIVPSPGSVLKHAMLTKSNAVFVIPSFIQAWIVMGNALEYLKSLEFLCYAGGPLPPKIGEDLVAAGVRLQPIYGGTEFGSPTCRAPTKGDEHDWEYVRFYKHMNVRWAPQGDGSYECQFLACEAHRPVLFNLPDVEGYATGDIFVPHPTKEYMWKIIGRLDDVVVHATGEKTVPGPIEVIITSDPLIQNAIVFGRARNQTGVLIELRTPPDIDLRDQSQLARLRNKIWPSIEEANKEAPTFSRIYKEMILFTMKDKPLPRSIKATVLRKAALILYEAEINALYDNVEQNITAEQSRLVSWNTTDVENWIREQATDITSKDQFSSDVSLFDQGFDSLSATILRLRIINAMRSSGDPKLEASSRNISQNLLYDLPTIKEITAHITTSSPATEIQISQRISHIETLVTKYSEGLSPLENTVAPHKETSGVVVVLTGSTGNLGSQILATLLNNAHVSRVYAFNRRSEHVKDLLDRQKEKFEDIGIDLTLLESKKLVLVTGDSTRSDLGIDKQLYNEISSSLDVLIHNAWQLDFNIPLPSYEPVIQSSRNLIDLVRRSPAASNARFIFISSVASAQSWDDSRGPVPDDVVNDPAYALGGGYGEAKYIVERVLANSGLHTRTVRVGQICGGHPRGSWPTTEWFPMLVRSSITLGVIPDLSGPAAWITGNSASSAVVDVALAPTTANLPPVFNLMHPQPVEQKVIIDGIVVGVQEVMGLKLRVVPFNEWILALEKHAEKGSMETLATIPAIKLVTFLRRYTTWKPPRKYSLDGIRSVSTTMHPDHITQITGVDAKLWVEYWHGRGYLS
ncbi:putative NRPS-like protein biosynthetic cluster [Tephrocybe rancida]|nr:putative NRPS-like protein biosynthetic cluster [Tephrocybe rancida]